MGRLRGGSWCAGTTGGSEMFAGFVADLRSHQVKAGADEWK